MSWMRGALTIFTCGIILLCPALVHAEIPGEDNPHAYTEHDYRKQLLEFNRRTIVEAYKSVGHHDEKWDEPALAFLDGMAIRFSNSGVQAWYRLPGDVDDAKLLLLAETAINAGCDDPLIADLYSVVLQDNGQPDKAKTIVRKAADDLAQSNYPAIRAASSARRALLGVNWKNDRPLYDHYFKLRMDGYLATLKLAAYPGIDRRILFSFIKDEIYWHMAVADTEALYNAAKAANSDPWLTDMIGGTFHIFNGWEGRGSGWANTVTADGWKQLSAEAAEARKCLEEAYQLEPTFPESCERMMAVCTAESNSAEMRTWFDRSVTAQFDYSDAYFTYSRALWPRWFGSHDEMFAFGVECEETKRFDTRVPWILIDVLDQIRDDDNGSYEYLSQPNVWQHLKNVVSSYSKTDIGKANPLYYPSLLMGYGFQAGYYADVKELLDQSGDRMDPDACGTARLLPSRTYSGIHALTGPASQQLMDAEKDAASGKFDDAIAAYEQAAKDLKENDPSAPYIRGRIAELKWLKDFNGGDWVNIMPDSNLDGWYNSGGEFTSTNGILTGTCDGSGALICAAKFGTRFELKASLELLVPGKGKSIDINADAGVYYSFVERNKSSGFFARPVAQQAVAMQGTQPPWTGKWVYDDTQANFDLRMWDDTADADLMGHPFFRKHSSASWYNGPNNLIGIGSSWMSPGSTFKVTELKIRKLDTKPSDEKKTDF